MFASTLAGTPATTQLSGISLVTMEPAPIIQLFPIETPDNIIHLIHRWPIKVSSPILTPLQYLFS